MEIENETAGLTLLLVFMSCGPAFFGCLCGALCIKQQNEKRSYK